MVNRIVFCAVLLGGALAAQAEVPRYRGEPNRQYVFDVTVTADLPTKIDTLQGRIVYQVKAAGEPLKFTYRGGLKRSSQKKPGAEGNSPDPFGPRSFAHIPPPPGPFERRVDPFQGLSQTTNELTMKPDGEFLALEGSSQLPYLLGNLCFLVFEPLPATDQTTWKVESGVQISEAAQRTRRFPPFPGDPFAGRAEENRPEKSQAGGESATYALEREAGSLVTYKKTYRLESPGDKESVAIDGQGRWTFNRQLGMSESLDFQQTMTLKEGNITIAVPVTIKYRRLSDEEWAKSEQERLAAEQQKQDEQARMTAEAKAKADAPLEGAERQQVLAALKQRDAATLEAALKLLAGKTPRSDAELAQAIQPHVNHAQKSVQDAAKKALAAFSPEFKRTYDLNQRYRGSKPVTELGPWISYDTPLPPGLIVAANRYGRSEFEYYPTQIVEVLDSGLIKIKDPEGRPVLGERLREDMFLPPPEIEQPFLNDAQRAALQAYYDDIQAALGASPAEAQRLDQLNRAYRDSQSPVPQTGAPVPDGVKLPKFYVVAAQKKDGQWYQAHVSGELSDGRIAVRFSGEPFDDKLPRSSLRFPPPEVKAVNLPPVAGDGAATTASAEPAFRTWSDRTGQFTIHAKYVGEAGDKVRLLRQDGKELAVPLNQLSEADQRYVATVRQPVNPFAQ